MKKNRVIITILTIASLSACATATHDLAKTLRYADGQRVGVKNVDLKELQTRKRGEACTWNLLFFLPVLGDGSIISAANKGNINNVELIGETGVWYFPFNKHCTIVYGDSALGSSSAPIIQTSPNKSPTPPVNSAEKPAPFWQ